MPAQRVKQGTAQGRREGTNKNLAAGWRCRRCFLLRNGHRISPRVQDRSVAHFVHLVAGHELVPLGLQSHLPPHAISCYGRRDRPKDKDLGPAGPAIGSANEQGRRIGRGPRRSKGMACQVHQASLLLFDLPAGGSLRTEKPVPLAQGENALSWLPRPVHRLRAHEDDLVVARARFGDIHHARVVAGDSIHSLRLLFLVKHFSYSVHLLCLPNTLSFFPPSAPRPPPGRARTSRSPP